MPYYITLSRLTTLCMNNQEHKKRFCSGAYFLEMWKTY